MPLLKFNNVLGFKVFYSFTLNLALLSRFSLLVRKSFIIRIKVLFVYIPIMPSFIKCFSLLIIRYRLYIEVISLSFL